MSLSAVILCLWYQYFHIICFLKNSWTSLISNIIAILLLNKMIFFQPFKEWFKSREQRSCYNKYLWMINTILLFWLSYSFSKPVISFPQFSLIIFFLKNHKIKKANKNWCLEVIIVVCSHLFCIVRNFCVIH